jgi:E3 ubiquitin-protein ligase HUWE1
LLLLALAWYFAGVRSLAIAGWRAALACFDTTNPHVAAWTEQAVAVARTPFATRCLMTIRSGVGRLDVYRPGEDLLFALFRAALLRVCGRALGSDEVPHLYDVVAQLACLPAAPLPLNKVVDYIGARGVECLFVYWQQHAHPLRLACRPAPATLDACAGLLETPTYEKADFIWRLFSPDRSIGGLTFPAEDVFEQMDLRIAHRRPISAFLNVLSTGKVPVAQFLSVGRILEIATVSEKHDLLSLHHLAWEVIGDSDTRFRYFCHGFAVLSRFLKVEPSACEMVVVEDSQMREFQEALQFVFEWRPSHGSHLFLTLKDPCVRRPSETAFALARALLQSTHPRHFNLLASLVVTAPFIFTELPDFDPLAFIQRVLPLITNVTDSGNPHDLPYSVLLALLFLCFLPSFADKFVPFIFENLETLEFEPAYAFLLILWSLVSYSPLQHIVIGLMVHYNWPQMFITLVNKHSSPDFITVLLEILVYFLKSAVNLRAGLFSSATVIAELPNPFTRSLGETPALRTAELVFPFSSLASDGTAELDLFLVITHLQAWTPTLPLTPVETPGKRVLAMMTPSTERDICPPCFSPKCWAQLPDSKRSAILHNDLPRIKKRMTAQVYRFLIDEPSWIAQWIATRPAANDGLLPRHYAQLAEVIDRLNALDIEPEPCDADDFGVSLVNSPELYRTILKLTRINDGWQRRRDFLSDFLIVAGDVPALSDIVFAVISEFMTEDHPSSQFAHVVELLLSIPHCVDPYAVFAAASHRRNRGNVEAISHTLRLARVCTADLSSPSFIQFLRFLLFQIPTGCLRAILPILRKLDNVEITEVHRRYLRWAVGTNPMSDDFLAFLGAVRPRMLISDEADLLLPVLENLLVQRPSDVKLIDRLFGVFGRRHGLHPSDPTVETFWRIVHAHHDYISARIGAVPGLLETTYGFMVGHQSLLSFPVRFKAFLRRMRRKHSRMTFAINVRRDFILVDSFEQLHKADTRAWLGHLHVSFTNEPGIDGGGLLREWLAFLSRELFSAGSALFVPTANRRSFQPNAASGTGPLQLAYFAFTGKIFAFAIVHSVYLAPHLSLPFLKGVIGAPLCLDDLADVDDTLFNGMKWVQENSVAGLPSELFFTIGSDSETPIELKENGASIPVTDDNKAEYVDLVVEHKLHRQIERQTDAFCQGFYELIAQRELKVFDAWELDSVICGQEAVDVADWQRHCDFGGEYSQSHPVILTFFAVIGGWSQEDLARLLAFVTGSPQVPLGGFAEFREMGKPLVIRPGGGPERLVTAHTCTNTLDLPAYDNRCDMQEKLMYAIDHCTEYGFR